MFISFEGSEGVGKSTLVNSLSTWLNEQGHEVVTTREPGGTQLAEKIRALVLQEPMCAETELLLMFAARAQHLHEIILPALAAKKWVLCDRFVDASFAYQGAGRGIATSKIQQLENDFVTTLPNFTFWLNAPVEIGLARANARKETDRFEQEKVAFFKQIQAGYADRVTTAPDRFIEVDATKTAQDVFDFCTHVISSHLFKDKR